MASTAILSIESRAGSTAAIKLPERFTTSGWVPAGLPPIEVIDGQHRLWAFDETGAPLSPDLKDELDGFELPVVAFDGLDISFQAYLFWTINIKPVRINANLAFDLYPLLRTESWLEKSEGHAIYRETRVNRRENRTKNKDSA